MCRKPGAASLLCSQKLGHSWPSSSRQEARMILHKAVQSYVPEKGLQFASFYKLTLKHHIFGLIRKESASGYFEILSDFEQAVFIRFING